MSPSPEETGALISRLAQEASALPCECGGEGHLVNTAFGGRSRNHGPRCLLASAEKENKELRQKINELTFWISSLDKPAPATGPDGTKGLVGSCSENDCDYVGQVIQLIPPHGEDPRAACLSCYWRKLR